jgi:hypothetical protein
VIASGLNRLAQRADRFFVTRPEPKRPPLYTVLSEVVGWTLDHTANIPKSSRFTFGQRLDNACLDALEETVSAIYDADRVSKVRSLRRVSLLIERSRALWRLAQDRGWMSRQQLAHVMGRLDECGRMVGGWVKQQEQVLAAGAKPKASPR